MSDYTYNTKEEDDSGMDRLIEFERKELLQKMHDGYKAVYEENLELVEYYAQMAREGYQAFEIAQLHRGKCSALIHVINDIRYVLNKPPIGMDSDAYGYIFNVE